MKKIAGPVLLLFIFASLVIFGVGTGVLVATTSKIPDVSKLVEEYKPVVPTTIYDAKGVVVDTFGKERREIATIEEIPKHAQYAFVAIEDRNFFNHHGFDVLRTLKAIQVNLVKMRKAQGGSTITQQLAKNAFLTNEKKISRKVEEAIIAVEIERKYTKEEILEKYLNEIYFGSGAYGIKTASKVFFNKDIKDINIAEAAFLAGIPNSPKRYSPFEHFDNALKRQKIILNAMKKYNFITEKEYQTASSFKLKVSASNQKIYRSASFMTIISKELEKLNEQKIIAIGENEINEGGYKIYTGLDLKMQKIAEETINSNEYLNSSKRLEAGFITIDPNNGFVKAVVGGKYFKYGNFNRAMNSTKQPGSSFKPFVYFTALQDKNLQLNTILEDSPVKIGDWSPENYENENLGGITMLEALEKSINTIAVKLLLRSDVDNVIATAQKAGITSKLNRDGSIALGTIALSPFELAKSYIPFANGGFTVEPVFITKIEDRYGNSLYEYTPKKEKVFEPENVAMIVQLMKNAVMNGTGKKAYVGIEQAGKTGTTNDYVSAWFAGFTPDLVTTVYLGFDDNKSMGKGMSGGGVAAPICGTFYKRIINEAGYKPQSFEFIDNLIEQKSMYYKDVDVANGLIADATTTDKRVSIFKREYLPVEKAGKYKTGLSNLLN